MKSKALYHILILRSSGRKSRLKQRGTKEQLLLFCEESKNRAMNAIVITSVVSLTDLYTIFFRHSRVNGNPVALVLDSCSLLTTCRDKFRRNDNLSIGNYGTIH